MSTPSASRPGPVVAETSRLRLRHFADSDAPTLARILGMPEVMHFSANRRPWTPEEVDAALARWQGDYAVYGYGLYAVENTASGRLMGYCGFLRRRVDDALEVEIGYRLDPAFWGKGFATEAATACRDYGFNTLGRTRLISLIEPANHPSIRVAEKTGMRHEKDFLFRDTIPVRVYSITSAPCP